MLYEFETSLQDRMLKAFFGPSFTFPEHFQSSFELCMITEGEACFRIDGLDYELKSGDAVLIFPNQMHSITSVNNSMIFLCFFSPDLVASYTSFIATSKPKSNLFSPSKTHMQTLLNYEKENIFNLKSALYAMCGEFHKNAEYVKIEKKDSSLIEKIFRFIEENYQGDCTLSSLSHHIGYHHVYLSRYFKNNAKISFVEYVNNYRVNEARYLLRSTQKNILDISSECGFHSLRTFNATFKNITGQTPREYRIDTQVKNAAIPF